MVQYQHQRRLIMITISTELALTFGQTADVLEFKNNVLGAINEPLYVEASYIQEFDAVLDNAELEYVNGNIRTFQTLTINDVKFNNVVLLELVPRAAIFYYNSCEMVNKTALPSKYFWWI